MKNYLIKYQTYVVLFFLVAISFYAFLYFFLHGQQNLLYGDALSRMNISRKIIDNLTPGLAQLGNVWLPLPQLLMLMFVWNNDLWRTGIAGAIISMSAYVIGGLYLYKSAKLISKSFFASILALSVYALNINLLYLQTTAMSEAIFLCFLITAVYYFLMWIATDLRARYLVFAGLCMTALTLIRYEALALLLSSIPMVFGYAWFQSRRYHKAEGATILYGLLAILGFAIWTIYLAAIFGDPLYWKNYYTSTHTVGDDKTQLHVFTHHLTFLQAFWKYMTAVVWMNGVIPVAIATVGLCILIFQSIKNRSFYFLPVLLSLSMYAFMILTLQRNTPIDQPQLTLANLLSPTTSRFVEFNIRYGLLMLPLISLLCLYVFKTRFIFIKILFLLILCVQFYMYFNPVYSLIFQLPLGLATNITQGTTKEKEMVAWMKKNYDGGMVMISALKHDPQMLQMNLNYKNYIHEGTGKYWKESKKDPQRYATWAIFDSYNNDDQVTKYLKKSAALKLYYNLVYENDGMLVYKIKTKPDVNLDKND